MRPTARLIGASLFFNGLFVALQVHRFAYDTYVHVFLADHYRQRWWSLWEPRWYLGFSVASYPPLIHQLIALISCPFSAVFAWFGAEPYPGAWRVQGEEAAYVVLLLVALLIYPLAVRRFSRIFFGPHTADRAAWLAVFLPALSLSAWSFGQLPTIAATGAALIALERGYTFTQSGRWLALVQAVALAGVVAASHHAVFLFVPFAGLAILLRVTDRRSHPSTAPARIAPLARLLIWGLLSALVVAAVLWPFLMWSRAQPLQTPIDHLSRHNFLTDWAASGLFFWLYYGPLVATIPVALRIGQRRRYRPLLIGWILLFVLGLGGTTPVPRWLFGAFWEWLTYDRFSLWAATLLLPFAAAVVLMGKFPKLFAQRHAARWRRLSTVFMVALILWSCVAGAWSRLAPAQPPPIDFAPIVRFLDQPGNRVYRYLTLGFGDQFARLSALTDNGSLDGDYHTARQLPELQQSGLGALDTAAWTPQGAWAVRPFLAQPERYGLRWVFADHPSYDPVLIATGWRMIDQQGGATVWEHDHVQPLIVPTPPEDEFAAHWWGIAPLFALAVGLIVLSVKHRN